MPALDKVAVDITVVLGCCGSAALPSLSSTTEEYNVDILANNLTVAKDAVAVNGNRITVEVTKLCCHARRICAKRLA